MKKSSFTLLFSLVVVITAKGQNYSPIVNGNTSLFKSTTDSYLYVTHVDSMTTDQGKESCHFLKTITEDPAYCYNEEYAADWTGPKLLKDNSAFYFFNKEEDSIKLLPTKEIGASWKLYTYADDSYIEATITAKEQLTFLTLTDSVKTISLQLKDAVGTNVASPLNNLTLQISKNYGILSLFAFVDFPNTYPTYELKGLSSPAIGLQIPTSRQFYNFSVDDEFHYEESKTNSGVDDIKRVIKIIAKYVSANTDTLRYTISDYNETTTYYQMPPSDPPASYYETTSSSTEYVRQYIVNDSITYPIKRLLKDEFSNYALQTCSLRIDEINNDIVARITDSIPLTENGECLSPVVDYQANHLELLEGAGILFYDRSFFMPYRERLVYYKKGSDTWGTALTLSNYSAAKNVTLSLFPNPLKQGELLHWNTNQFNPSQVVIYNGTGNKVVETLTVADADDSLDVSNLQPGLYFVQLVNDQQEVVTSKLLIK